MPRALLLDASPDAPATAAALAAAGLDVVSARDLDEAAAALEAGDLALAFVDAVLPCAGDAPAPTGVEVLASWRSEHPDLPVILVSGLGTVPAAVAALRAGAAYYLEKPLVPAELTRALAAALDRAPKVDPTRPAPRPAAGTADLLPELVGVSASLGNAKQLIRAAARTLSPALISGPSGTGKELVASAIHRLSARAAGPFLAVNCGALPDGLAEAELFGAEKGAYTGSAGPREGLFRAAQGGTLFLDELGEMPAPLQVKLLRVLQQRAVRPVGGTRELPVDVRVVAATNRQPWEAVQQGLLREDLYFRLAVLRIQLEPLASRPEDVAPLVEALLTSLRARYGEGPTHASPAALAHLAVYPWPGNVRELENVLDSVFAMGEAGDELRPEHLPAYLRDGPWKGLAALEAATPEPLAVAVTPAAERATPPASDPPLPPGGDLTLMPLRDAELYMIRKALLASNGNKAHAARLLGVSRPYLYRRLEALNGEGEA